MHFEILVEDASGKIILESVLKKIVNLNSENHFYNIHGYKGIGGKARKITDSFFLDRSKNKVV
jgi:hypothetical protein